MKTYGLKWLFALLLLSCSGQISRASSAGGNGLLDAYLKVKDALVADDAVAAKKAGTALYTLISATGSDNMAGNEKKVFENVKSKLLEFSQKIGATSDIEKQRTAMESLSIHMWKYVKASTTEKRVVYYQYCPMKKAWWISLESAIKNPYYGSAMLSCGSIAETKNK